MGGCCLVFVTQGDVDATQVLVDVQRGPGEGGQAGLYRLVYLINKLLTQTYKTRLN